MKWGIGGWRFSGDATALGLILGSQGILGRGEGDSLVGERLIMRTLGTLENNDPWVLGVSQESRSDSGAVSGHGLYWNPGGGVPQRCGNLQMTVVCAGR